MDMLGLGQTNNRRTILDEINALNKKFFKSSHPLTHGIVVVASEEYMLNRYGGCGRDVDDTGRYI